MHRHLGLFLTLEKGCGISPKQHQIGDGFRSHHEGRLFAGRDFAQQSERPKADLGALRSE